jgi:L-ascorbate metabolism protein UlaG (beta-lactamase superfamily)
MANQARLVFHRRSFFELTTPKRTLFIDPVFSHERRGKRVGDATRSSDYVLATSLTPWFDDTLDLLEDSEATFVSTPRLRRYVAEELDLDGHRLLDLEPWERASEQGLRITAVPISGSLGLESAIGEGMGFVRDFQSMLPRGVERLPLVGQALPLVDSSLRSVTGLFGAVRPPQTPQSLDRMGELLGLDVGRLTGGRPGVGYFIEVEGASVLHLADGVHEGTRDEDLEDMAELCQPDVLVAQAGGTAVEPIVRAARILEPKTVLLYRARDPYREGRRGQTLPMGSFLAALEEGAPDAKAQHLRPGDGFSLERNTPARTDALRKAPSATTVGSPPAKA